MNVRPSADIASFPSVWATAPFFSKVNSADPDDSTFVTSVVPGGARVEIAFALPDLEIPDGASGRIRVRLRLRWSAVPTVIPTVRVGLGLAADLGVTNPTLEYVDSVTYIGADFSEIEVTFPYADWSGDSSVYGFYLEVTPDVADATLTSDLSWVEVESCRPASICPRCYLGNLTPEAMMVQARDLSPTYEQRNHPSGVLLRQLSSFEKSVTNRMVKTNPTFLASNLIINLPIGDGSPDDFALGVELPQITYMLPGAYARTNSQATVNTNLISVPLINATLQDRVNQDYGGRAIWLQNGRLYFSGATTTWQGFQSIQLRVVLTPADFLLKTSPLLMPDHCEDLYVGFLMGLMATRERDQIGMAIAQSMQDDVWSTITQQKAAESFVTVDEWPGGT